MRLWEDFSDLEFKDLTYEEGNAEIDALYGASPERGPPPVETEANAAPTAQPQPAEQGPVADTQDEFADLMKDIATLPDEPAPENAFATAAFEDPFPAELQHPATPSFLAPGSPVPSNLQNELLPSSSLLPQGKMPRMAGHVASPAPYLDAPSSGNRSLMQAEMRQEEDSQTSPLPMASGPIPRFSLDTTLVDNAEPSSETPIVSGSVHMQKESMPQLDLNEQLFSNNTWNFDNLTLENRAKQRAAQAKTTQPSPNPLAPAPAPDSRSERAKRRRREPSPPLFSPDEEPPQDTRIPEPPTKRQKSSVEETARESSDEIEVKHVFRRPTSQSHANKEQSGSSSSNRAATRGKKKMAAPSEVSQEAKNMQESTFDDGETNNAMTANEEPSKSPKWGFDDLQEDDAQEEDTDNAPRRKKAAPKSKAKGKGKSKATDAASTIPAKRDRTSAITEPAPKAPPAKKSKLNAQQDLGKVVRNAVMTGVRKMDQEENRRKTRKKAKEEQEAEPDAAGAARRRHGRGAK